MQDRLNQTKEILEKLVGFDSISGQPNEPIVSYINDYLKNNGIDCQLSFDESQTRANLFATIGPAVDGGVVLNGHTDVVPVTGQKWTHDPFQLTRDGSRLYGRGAVDMKGFLACVLASVPLFKSAPLAKPVHIAFSFDEEIGGLGMPPLLHSMAQLPYRPAIAIVGEPTDMQLITGHKGGFEMRTEITGMEVHSCDPTLGVNAISVATKLIAKIESIAAAMAANPIPNSLYTPPYCTFNIGTIEGGSARNATAGWCNFDWEFRPLPGENTTKILQEIADYAQHELLPPMQAINANASINIIAEAPVPPLLDTLADEAAGFVCRLTGLNSRDVVSFGTDAGYFSDAGISTVVFGPGSINRAHKADEYIEVQELHEGLQFLEKVSNALCR